MNLPTLKKTAVFLVVFLCLSVAGSVFAYQPRIIYSQKGDVKITDPEIQQYFFDQLNGKPRDYLIDSDKNFNLDIALLVPETANPSGRFSAKVSSQEGNTADFAGILNADSADWHEIYDSFGRDYYLKGPELSYPLVAGKYKIEIFSADNKGKYVLTVGKKESFDIKSLLNIYWQLPLLKIVFFKTSVLQFFLTPFGIAGFGAFGALLIFFALIYYLVGLIKAVIMHHRAKTLLLTSNGMQMKKEIIELLQKPAYDITVGFIITAYKYKFQENPDYVNTDLQIMRDEMGFNVEEIDIEGRREHEVMKLLELKDIVFVSGGNAFYLLKAMRACNFAKIIRKLFKKGKVYIGSSAGSIVAGRTIKTAEWLGDENTVKLKNLKGLHFVPFDIFVHYQPENATIIKQKIKSPRKRRKKLRILTDAQAILVQGKEIDLIGEGDAIIV